MSKLVAGLGAGAALSYLTYRLKRGLAKQIAGPKLLTPEAKTTAPPMKSVKSSMIKELGYADGDLKVRFNDGRIYEFKRVPKAVYARIMKSGSVGSSFNRNVKDKYEYEKVGSARPPIDRISPPVPMKSLSQVLDDLRKLDTPDKWNAYRRGQNNRRQSVASHHVK
jgi:hypothetical protein